MKSGVSLIIPAGLLLFSNLAEAGIFLKAKDPFIIQGKTLRVPLKQNINILVCYKNRGCLDLL